MRGGEEGEGEEREERKREVESNFGEGKWSEKKKCLLLTHQLEYTFFSLQARSL